MESDAAEAARQRRRMVEEQIAARGIHDPGVLDAMARVPRERFVADTLVPRAYDDSPLPIGQGQTISQPYIVALMLGAAALTGTDRVLEVGAGSGYASAVASLLAGRVDAIERHAALAAEAAGRLAALGFANVAVHCADGSTGWPAGAPFDAILVAAGGPRIPEALKRQLAPGGRLVMPVGGALWVQQLVKVTKMADGSLETEDLGGVRFVPLIGEEGWDA